ncbi:N-acetylmuramoyl-L-alanine amidase family protein [Halalkalibacter akibai]|uniref:N-acetylmuramoyl-L-alanine amidase n=1 Tax=Halalkalibacter akibai (strain ATCC 43226 / DSM 21942 / CIP 109018 / JCM 9157 / 1139) TaxID=1236973 RepID=W4QXL4_HALA3|nr:N-acetylmuramoyl-L-alanine amidase [Halalkalibacter akibai]GAE36647.1 N-acetylmuramoyl-L-alanine amidase [Halalkalibacter akibai JCM 9157]
MTKVKIMLDPGHGGKDPGAVANGLQEKDIVLTIAREMRHMLLQQFDVLVKMTRTSDTFLSLEERARLANNWGADYFLSIHVNAAGGTGFESFIHPNAQQDTIQFQQAIHSRVMAQLKVRDRGMKKSNFAVLRLTKMPAILTENLFIDNKEDANLLGDIRMLKKIAEGHVNGLERLLKLNSVKEQVVSKRSLYRVLVNGKQIGAFGEKEYLLNQVGQYLGTASRIELEQVN